jgi:D-3-phosphoglycerate dehydrogenase
MIGLVGTLLGEADVNISSMQVGRQTRRGAALMVLAVDEPVTDEVIERIRQAASISSIKVLRL